MKKIIAVIIGAGVGTIIFFIVGTIANKIQPTPPELMNPSTAEAVANRVASTSMFTWISTIFGLSLGTFSAGAIGTIVAKEKIAWVTTAIGLVFSLWAFYTFYIVFPAVLWVPISMLISALLFSYLGGVVIKQSQQKRNT